MQTSYIWSCEDVAVESFNLAFIFIPSFNSSTKVHYLHSSQIIYFLLFIYWLNVPDVMNVPDVTNSMKMSSYLKLFAIFKFYIIMNFPKTTLHQNESLNEDFSPQEP